jgi:predicted alpha/beta-fold hydrolase
MRRASTLPSHSGARYRRRYADVSVSCDPTDDARLEFPAFEPRAPWWGPDLQTLRNTLRRPRPRVDARACQRLVLPLADGSGDALSGLLECPLGPERRPLAVLVHGLGGSEDSAYLAVSAAHLLARGHPVLRLNLRGAGPARPLCRFQYHAGRTEDLRDALASLPRDLMREGLLLVGFSLGANMLLKFLAEHAHAFPVRAAAAVSAPIDLEATSRRFLAPRNRLYLWHMLQGLKRESLAEPAQVSEAERAAIRSARSVWEFDDRFVAPRNGWASAEAYYAANSARQFLSEVRVPTVLVHALDDPWIPPKPYTSFPWRENPCLLPLLAERGGHVGFHGRGDRMPWHDRCLALFLDGVGA